MRPTADAAPAGRPPIVFLMGPTATGKTAIAIELVRRGPFEIVSVDSAQVYRGLDIGSAKPPPEVLRRAPHRLVDICDPAERYNAGRFRADALVEIAAIVDAGRVPLLVGGTMLYFRALEDGLAPMPPADPSVRAALDTEAAARGWPALHARLAQVDPDAAGRIHPNDRQRIQRALEVYELSGRPISAWQRCSLRTPLADRVLRYAVAPPSRAVLWQRIEKRLDSMICAGFVDEVERLARRGDLNDDSPSMRAVGYRQFWQHVTGRATVDEARERAIVATRRLAKRQMTWLRSLPDVHWIDPGSPFDPAELSAGIIESLREHLPALC